MTHNWNKQKSISRRWNESFAKSRRRFADTMTPPTPPEGAPARSRARDIDGFRGLAALSTIVFHVWQQYFRYDAGGSHPHSAQQPKALEIG